MENVFEVNLRGFEIKLKRVPGVFSARGLDEGTRLLADNLVVENGTLIADLGSGSGALGIIAAKLNREGHIHLLDDHLRSVELAKENVEINRLRNAEVYLSDLFSAVPGRTYNQIISNPPQQLGNDFLEELIEESYKHLKPSGSLWLVVKTNLRPVLERLMKSSSSLAMKEKFKGVKILAHSKGYVLVKGVKS